MIESIIILILILLNGLFVAAEFAIVAAPRASLEALHKSGSNSAGWISSILKNPLLQDQYIATAQVGITISSLALGMYGEHVIADWLAEILGVLTFLELALVHTLASILSVMILTYFHIVLGEMIPKSLALERSQSVLIWLAFPMRIFIKLFAPAVIVLNKVNYMILKKVFGIRRESSTIRAFSHDELQLILKESEIEGAIENEIGTVIDQVFEFGELTAEDVMIPRVHMVALPVRPKLSELKEVLKETPHSRYPVFSGDKDNIIGVVHIKDLVDINDSSEEIPVPIRPVPFVPESAPLEMVLEDMKEFKTHMVVVLDEYGGTAGIITMQEIFDEFFGEIDDSKQSPSIKAKGDNTWMVKGTVRLEEIAELFKLTIDEPEINTIGGFVLDRLGRPPKTGDEVRWHNLIIQVARTRGRAAVVCIIKKSNNLNDEDDQVDL